MEYLHSLLKFAVNMGASDIHVKAGHHATIRISGELIPVQVDPPSIEQVVEVVRTIIHKHLEARLDREKEGDFSYVHENLGRFLANVVILLGNLCIAMRHVKSHIPSFTDLHLPE